MLTVIESAIFKKWLGKLKDGRARSRVLIRVKRLAAGNSGDVKPVGQGVSEMRIHYGPGYRVYFMQRGTQLVVLLCGGDKSTQQTDIERAKRLAQEWED